MDVKLVQKRDCFQYIHPYLTGLTLSVGYCRVPRNGVYLKKAHDLLSGPFAKQADEAERPTKSLSNKPARRSGRPSHCRASLRGGGPNQVFRTRVSCDRMRHHHATSGHEHNIPNGRQEDTVSTTVRPSLPYGAGHPKSGKTSSRESQQ
jgi:hypothetical protein